LKGVTPLKTRLLRTSDLEKEEKEPRGTRGRRTRGLENGANQLWNGVTIGRLKEGQPRSCSISSAPTKKNGGISIWKREKETKQ